jgi:hypothetical protein
MLACLAQPLGLGALGVALVVIVHRQRNRISRGLSTVMLFTIP